MACWRCTGATQQHSSTTTCMQVGMLGRLVPAVSSGLAFHAVQECPPCVSSLYKNHRTFMSCGVLLGATMLFTMLISLAEVARLHFHHATVQC